MCHQKLNSTLVVASVQHAYTMLLSRWNFVILLLVCITVLLKLMYMLKCNSLCLVMLSICLQTCARPGILFSFFWTYLCDLIISSCNKESNAGSPPRRLTEAYHCTLSDTINCCTSTCNSI